MEFDQAFPGTEWNFPSPGATPTHPSFSNNVLQTPKTATFPSHFQDAFTTPQMPDYVTPQPQQYAAASMTPLQRPQTSMGTLPSNFYGPVQVYGGQGTQPPPAHMGHQATMPSPAHGAGFHYSPAPPGMQLALDSSQMRTPPPTRGSLVTKFPHPAQVAFGTPSTIASRRFNTPQQPVLKSNAAPAQQTPIQFPQLQFSPDMYQFARMGPASAPVMPQTHLLWAQTSSPNTFAQQSPLEDPFAPTPSHDVGWLPSSSQPQNVPQTTIFQTPAMTSFAVQPPHPRPSSALPPDTNSTSTAGAPSTMGSLDPSLIYSSPVLPIVRSRSRASQAHPEHSGPTLPKRKDSAAPAQPPRDSKSPAASATDISGPGLRRSNTASATGPKSTHLSVNAERTPSHRNSATRISRSVSPLKRTVRTPLGSISGSKPKRTPVILTIDENGMARTETVSRPEEITPTNSIRKRYPGLFDSDSEDESEPDEQPPSRSASSSFAKGEERRSKAAKLDPPVENLEGIDLPPRSSSRASTKGGATPSKAAIAAAAQLRQQGSLRKSSRATPSKRNPMTRSTSSLTDTACMDMSVEQQQANAGAGRHESALDAHNRRWSMMCLDQDRISANYPSSQALPSGPAPRQLETAPLLIRCICGSAANHGQPLVQCTSCTQWLHTDCIGVDGRWPPADYTCFLCIKPAVQSAR